MNIKNKLKMTTLIVVAGCFSQNVLTAQENIAIPRKKNFAAELNFKPFGENVISFNQLQLKYRVADNLLFRLGLAFDSKTLDQKGDDYEASEQRKVAGNEKSSKFGILPGVEFHFLKNSKISPYVGAELSFFNRSIKSHYRDYNYEEYYNYTTGNYEMRYIPIEIDIDGATRTITTEYLQYSQGYYYY
ncbi:hypothetical protein FACS189429_4390 [Bacteroidia bacterium]|nr:hypothetical protein FACS189429_4390 [Bacteroidia bacterium]GHV45171.1 hypothetical protein FACS1894180_7420 [Bacteroidia bacterium]